MSLGKEKQIRNYIWFLLFFVLLLWLAGLLLYVGQMRNHQNIWLTHSQSVTASLLEQGVSKTVIARAVTSTKSSAEGEQFLNKIGITRQINPRFLRMVSGAQWVDRGFLADLGAGILLSVVLLGGSIYFYRKMEQRFLRACEVMDRYIEGDYSCHLEQDEEGPISQIFHSVEQLVTMLRSKTETEQKARVFLKNTISDISHQLKTPLAALSMYQEIMESEPDEPDTIREFASKMGQSLSRMENLIQSLLKITRLDAGAIAFHKSSCLVEDLISYSVGDLLFRAGQEQKVIQWDGPKEGILVCDKEWTGEAIMNLVKNALDHSPAGGVVSLTWDCTPLMVRIAVKDQGMGIAAEDIHHIFKRFYRSTKIRSMPQGSVSEPVPTASMPSEQVPSALMRSEDVQSKKLPAGNTKGVGLGLPLAKSIIEGQNGVISVQSREGEGTTFVLSFLTDL